ncbi:hypothetical protein GAH_01191 [Geoglobus ahangari]|uniref:DUF473 domain-containing protein n=1 Tax=Geoglobus ahangari TaxID=113653 RepID=A0A0F7IFC7_9EURY|nr:DUF473 domain-containing protein [Geoglobus ahangari]AKG91498.1 hypothetical protein GAH_01191 [Geoglobus ahangari]NOY11474.1 DUF473 domain-containing protein [Archaeoglobi archaeon]
MRCYIISGISRQVIEEILRGNLRTLELRNVINVATALNTKLGDCVFITTAKNVDLGRGVTGIIAEVEGKEIVSHSTFFARNDYFEECEMTVVRLRVRPKALGRLVQVFRKDLLSPVEGEAIQVDHFLAR